MKITKFVFLLFLFLAACAPASPYEQVAIGNARLQETQAAQQWYSVRATTEFEKLQDWNIVAQMEYNRIATMTQMAAEQTQVAATATAAYQATSTQSAINYAVTQTAYPPQATATQAALNIIADQDMLRRMEAAKEARRLEWQTYMQPLVAVAPIIFWTVMGLVFVVFLIVAYRRFAPAIEVRLRSISRGGGHTPLYVGDDFIADPSRGVGAGLRILKGGHIEQTGLHQSLPAQMQITGQAQIVDGISAMPRNDKKQANRLIGLINQQPPAALPPPVKVEIVDPEDREIGGWMKEVNRKLLEDGDEL